jgi:glycosyltransferase involved in cell wall biosynthesis
MPAVAVVMITYNHEPFIVESIESVFAQRYDGVIHLVVADDCSTDGTQALIADTLAHAPAHVIVHPLLRTSNVGGFGNLTGAWEVANQSGSSYIAILEGDDFWCDPSKLALQAGYLEAHPRATISFGLARELILFENPPSSKVVIIPPTEHPTYGDLLLGNFIQTCTVLYRAGVLPRFPEWFAECPIRDWPLHLVHASDGDMHYLDRVVAVHRQHEGGKWWTPGRSQRNRNLTTEAIQRVALAHLGTRGQVKGRRLIAARHAWRASSSRNLAGRYAHLAMAGVLDPRRAVRRVRRGRGPRSSSGQGST